MSTNDEHEIIDVEAVEIVDTHNLPAIIQAPASDTHGAAPPIEGRDWSTYSRPERRCTANSSRTGEPCKNVAIKGSNVCRYHGGAAKQVKQAARTRLENAADLMAKQLLGIALTADSEGVKLAAIRDALDRAGLRPPSEVVVTQGDMKPWEAVFDAIGGHPSQSQRESAGYDNSARVGVPPALVDQSDYPYAAESFSDHLGHAPSRPAPHEQPQARKPDRDTPRQPPERHITGDDAIRLANQANAANAERYGLPWGESARRR